MKFGRLLLLITFTIVIYSSIITVASANDEIGSRQVPNPLITLEGDKIENKAQWQQVRRPEVLELFRDNIYGRASVDRPDSLEFDVVDVKEDMMDGEATRKQIDISYEGPNGEDEFRLLLFVPNDIDRPVPTFLFMNNRGYENMDPDREEKTEFWPAEEIIDNGYAAAVFQVSEVAPDSPDSFDEGVHGVFDPQEETRASDAWGTIAGWSWGASRAMDYLETELTIDSNRVGVVGHSRGGKAALWAGAIDERFDLVISNNSGNTGAAISRGKVGETIEDINTSFPHWFNENYKSYNGNEYDLPVDQHMLIASMAPRLVYVSSASEDTWADPESEFLSLKYAESVYQLFGMEGLEINNMPDNDTPSHGEGMGYHVRTGEHNLKIYDWENFMDFWEPSNADSIKRYVDRFKEEGYFENDAAPHALQLHLTAINQYEKQEEVEKVSRHLEGFKDLLEHQLDYELISEDAYHTLVSLTNTLMNTWN
ncbi:acetylxylan esterase [Virgibacillus oceani]